LIGIVLKEGIKVEVSKKNGEMGSPRITVWWKTWLDSLVQEF
jgi:hypothetical protein